MFTKFVHFISLRYIKTRKVTRFAIGGIAIGVMVLLVVISVMDGFIKEFKSRLQGALSDVIITVRAHQMNYNQIEDIVKKHPNVHSCSPHLDGLVLIGTGRFYAGGMVLGIDYEKEYEVGKLNEYLVTSYKSQKLRVERIFEENVQRSRKMQVSWVVKAGEVVAEDGLFPAGTRIICEKIIKYKNKDPESKNDIPPSMSLIAYTFNSENKIIFIEDDLPLDELENVARLSEEGKLKWQQYFSDMSKYFRNRKLNEYMAHFDKNLRTYNGEMLGDVDPQNPFKTEEEGVRPVIMGYELMKNLQLKRGDEIGLMTGKRDETQDELKPITRKFVVVGSFRSGWQEIDARLCYTRRSDLRGFIDWPNDVKEVCVALKDATLAEETKYDIYDMLNKSHLNATFSVERWEDRRRTFLSAIQLERTVMYYILFFIVLLAVTMIMIILVLLVKEKTKDIGILRSMGASSNEIMWIFLYNGILISFLGAVIGCLLGSYISINVNVIADFIFEATGFRVFPRDIYYLDQIPSELNLMSIVWIVSPTLIFSVIFCAVPARAASKMTCVEALVGGKRDKNASRRVRGRKNLEISRIHNEFFSTKRLTKEYQMGSQKLRILDDVNFKASPGKMTAIIGPSGAGKSTLLHLLGMLDTPTSGHIYLDGIDLESLSQSQRCKILNTKIGFIFQFYHLFPEFTALENVLLATMVRYDIFSWQTAKKQKKQEAIDLLTRFGLADRLSHLPDQLSGGERQRVAIARALINNPQIVLCDEPTGNLDEDNSKSIQDLLWELNEQFEQTFVIVTHDLNIARRAHEVYKVEQKTLVKKDLKSLTQ
ncbi:ATP-binding cassette domain-containing protein [Candidatus Uabimicrobium sp. HlEnr_7]|uniref:ATP-binding cassette domain-containing protein n=1 Tax=Candidatus Uabimicrobium helgolandensis TaxID=3095367 RepID=UPI003558461E